MFENIVDSWTEKESGILDNLYKSLKSSEYINRIMILNSDLSEFTKNYILYEFDEESSSEDLKSRISKANKLYFNYALRPKWTLQTFLFNNFESRPPNEILKKLNIFTFYNYYSDSIRDEIKDNFQIFITKTELTSIIDSVNLSIYDKLSQEINSIKIKNFLLQLFLIKYEKESEYNLESAIPYSFVKIFLEDKSYTDFTNKFSVIKNLDSHTELSLKDIIKVLTDKYLLTKTSEKKETPVSPDLSDYEIEDFKIKKEKAINEIPENVEIEKTPAGDDDPEIVINPVTKILTGNIDLTEKINEPVETDKTKKLSGKLETKSKTVLDEKEKSKAKKSPEEDVKVQSPAFGKNAIGLLFDEKSTDRILKKIYKTDIILMDMSFTKLKNCKSWNEATTVLKQLFKKNDVDLYNKDVVFFVDQLNEYFKNKQKS